jgi:hypothetical protein
MNSGIFNRRSKNRKVTVERSRFVSVEELERMGEPLYCEGGVLNIDKGRRILESFGARLWI